MNTKFGVHIATGPRNGYGLVASARPATVISVGEGGALIEAWEKSDGQTITIFREQTIFHDAPEGIDHMTTAEARATADRLWPELLSIYRQNPADYYQPTNETGGDNPKSLANIMAFETRLMELAESEEVPIHLAIASLAGGSPGSWDLWVELIVPHIRRAGLGGHIYNRHAYGGVVENSSGFLTRVGPEPEDDNAGRPFREATFLRQNGILTPMIITEAGQNAGFKFPGKSPFIVDMARYDQLCQKHSNIWGFCAWTYGNYLDFPANIQPASQQMARYLSENGGAVRPNYPEPAIVEPGEDGEADSEEIQPIVAPISNPTLENDGDVPSAPSEHSDVHLDDVESNQGEPDATFVRFSTSDDLNNAPAGLPVTVTWRVRNSGNTIWGPEYNLVNLKEGLAAPDLISLASASGQQFVVPGQEVDLTVTHIAPDQINDDLYESIWRLEDENGQQFGHRLWVRAHVVPPPEQSHLETGVNINPDDPISNPLHLGVLKGLDWVRFPFKAADKDRTIADSFSEYDPIINGYDEQDVGTLLVLNQQTVAGADAPWRGGISWAEYGDRFAASAADIAAHYAHLKGSVAYEIWNEGDNPNTPWVSVFIPPEEYAHILKKTAAAIRQASPQSPILFGGLSTGPGQAVSYVEKVREALGGDLPVDAIGIHPYGRWPRIKPFSDWTFGSLAEVFKLFRERDIELPLWITELGIPGHRQVIGSEYYPTIARYFRDLFQEIGQRHATQVPVVIWYGWSDNMENAGIVKSDGTPKEGLFDVFLAVRDRSLDGLI